MYAKHKKIGDWDLELLEWLEDISELNPAFGARFSSILFDWIIAINFYLDYDIMICD